MAAPTELCIYGDIGADWWSGDGITENHVLTGLRDMDKDAAKHVVRINSPGGRVDTGLTILNLLRSHSAQMKAVNPAFQLETVVDGYAMSSASVIFMAGDVRTVALGGVLMIHDAWSGVYGNADEMRKAADRLELLSNNCAQIYATLATPAGKDQPVRDSSYFRTLMQAETYMVGDQGVSHGLATQQDLGTEASMFAEFTPEKLKGHYVSMMTEHYKKRTYNRPTAAKSILDAKAAHQRLQQLLATA